MMVFPLLVHYADVGTDTSLGAWTERGTFLSEFMVSKILFETGSLDEAKKDTRNSYLKKCPKIMNVSVGPHWLTWL